MSTTGLGTCPWRGGCVFLKNFLGIYIASNFGIQHCKRNYDLEMSYTIRSVLCVLARVQCVLKNALEARRGAQLQKCWPIVAVVPWLFDGNFTELNLGLLALTWRGIEENGAPGLQQWEHSLLRHRAEYIYQLICYM